MGRSAWSGVVLLLALGACAAPTEDAGGGAPVVAADTGLGADPVSGVVGDPTAGRRGSLSSSAAVSCVESYSAAAVAGRAFSFDGVVTRVGPSVSDRGGRSDLGLPGVTFEVREWFAGGRSDTVTVDLQRPSTSSDDPADPGYAYGVGSRLLVSGEARWGGSALTSPVAWGCGFSRYHDDRTADAWRRAVRDGV